MKTTNEYGATLLEKMGTDLSVVNAARVSFDKESDWENNDWNHPRFEEPNYLSERDVKLIHYLAKEGHWSPFAHAFLKFRVKAPIFVARQLQKHQVGLSWNEVSRRYVDSEPEFYVPREWRKKAENKKQGSSDEVVPADAFMFTVGRYLNRALFEYDQLLEAGVCPEQARMVLPQSTMTEWIWSGSLYAFARVCKERLHPSAQRETRWVAEDISQALATHFPVSWQALGPKDSINVS